MLRLHCKYLNFYMLVTVLAPTDFGDLFNDEDLD